MIDYNRISAELEYKINNLLKGTEYEWTFWLVRPYKDGYKVFLEDWYLFIKE